MLDDLKFALRRLRHSPGFAVVAILTLAVGVGANTAILSIADGVLFRPLPYRDPDRVFVVFQGSRATGRLGTIMPFRLISPIEQHATGLGEFGLFERGSGIKIETPDGPEIVPALAVSPSYFRVLGVQPRLGRVFADADPPRRTALLSYAGWQKRAGGNTAIVGQPLTLGSETFDIVGVLGTEFVFPTTPFFSGRPEIVTLLDRAALNEKSAFFNPVVRLEPGVTVDRAEAEMAAIVAPLAPPASGQKPPTFALMAARETMFPVGRPIMRFLVVAALLVLLVGCANLANMLLTRARRQEREIAVRSALGAGRLRVIRPILTEALIIGAVGAALALVVTSLTFDVLRQAVPNAALGNSVTGIDTRIVGIGLALGLAAGLIFSIVPALRSSRLDVLALLQGRHRNRRGRSVVGRPMVVLQVALAIVLVFGAAVATRAFVAVLREPIGFSHENVVQLSVGWPPGTTDIAGFYRRLLGTLSARPDVIAAGAAGSPPLSGNLGWSAVRRPGSDVRVAAVFHVLPGYFEALDIQPVQGRLLTWDDATTAPQAVLSESAARALFPGANALGQVVDDGRGERWQVAGVIPDIPSNIYNSTPPIYVIPTGRTTLLTIFARMRSTAGTLPADLRRELRQAAPQSPVESVWWSDAIGSLTQYKNPRFQTLVLVSFAAIALGLTALGIFGVVAFVVAARTREMGIRVAIGARPGSLVSLIVRQAMLPVGAGLVLGLIATRWAAKLAEAQLFKVQTQDPLILVLTATAVVLAALLAAWLPARRAARVDPILILRAE